MSTPSAKRQRQQLSSFGAWVVTLGNGSGTDFQALGEHHHASQSCFTFGVFVL